ncbi:MAG: M28 family peptidase, partial [Gemmatimonadota bacterium]
VVHADKVRERVDLQARLVFAGFGVTDSAKGYDDYAGIDARGKLVLALPGGPAALPPDERGHSSLLGAKEANALAHGAVGIVSLFPAPPELVQEKVNRQLDGFAWLYQGATPHTMFFELGATIRLTESGTSAVFAAAGKSFADVIGRVAKGGHEAFDLPVELVFKAEFVQVDTASSNVVGMLRGSDPKLRDEYVVNTAHYDHVGVGPPVNGDSVFHGALDNAGGTAVVIALARAYAALPKPPRRSVLFVAVSGEEKGILGSDYFSANPPVPIDRIVADVNMDNYLMLNPVKDLAAYGAGYSTLGDVVGHAFARLGIKLSADPAPGETIFTRSDHYPFMTRGVPAVMLFNGIGSGDGTRDGSAVLLGWLRTVHHTPRDRIDQGIDWGAGVTYAQANFLIGNEVANAEGRPRWKGRYFFRSH